MLIGLRFFTGTGIGAILPVSSTYVMEFAPTRRRGAMSVILNACWGLGGTFSALVGYTLVLHAGWRPAMALGGAALLLTPIVTVMLPESIRFLLSRGQVDQAVREFQRIPGLQNSGVDVPIEAGEPIPTITERRFTTIWKAPYTGITASLWVLWISLNFLYQGAYIWLPTLLSSIQVGEGKSYLLTLIISLGQIPGTLLVAYLADRVSRKKLIIASVGPAGSRSLLIGPFATRCMDRGDRLPPDGFQRHVLGNCLSVLF